MQATSASGVQIGNVSGDASSRSTKNSATLTGIYLEDNIEARPGTDIIPGIRFDYHDEFGSNWSPSLNMSQELGDLFKLKAGIARVFKAPNLYQSSEGYLLSTRGNGCPNNIATGSCYLLGNRIWTRRSVSTKKSVWNLIPQVGMRESPFRNDYKTRSFPGPILSVTLPTGITSCNGKMAAKRLSKVWKVT